MLTRVKAFDPSCWLMMADQGHDIDVSRPLGNPEIDVETNVNVHKGAGQYFFSILTNLSREFHIWQWILCLDYM